MKPAGSVGDGSRPTGPPAQPAERRARSRWALWLLASALGAAAFGWGWTSWRNAQLREAGLALYEGRLTAAAVHGADGEPGFSARLVGHEAPLPADAWRCVNCHSVGRVPAVALTVGAGADPGGAGAAGPSGLSAAGPERGAEASGAASGAAAAPRPAAVTASTEPYAVALTRDSLLGLRTRRGGPPSAFDEASLCRLLRTGVDPAQVLISTTMPRYTVSDVQCRQLMAYLLSL